MVVAAVIANADEPPNATDPLERHLADPIFYFIKETIQLSRMK